MADILMSPATLHDLIGAAIEVHRELGSNDAPNPSASSASSAFKIRRHPPGGFHPQTATLVQSTAGLNAEAAEDAEILMNPETIIELSHELIGAAIEVHRELGPGLLESAYESAFSHELTLRSIPHVRQLMLPIMYKGLQIETAYRIDVLVENRLVVELKAVEKILPLHGTQLLTYLRLGRYPLGLLINFNVRKLITGIERVSNDAPNLSAPSASSALKIRNP